MARELTELAYLVLARRVPYNETPPPRPGSVKAEAADSEGPSKSFPLACRIENRSDQAGGLAAGIAVTDTTAGKGAN